MRYLKWIFGYLGLDYKLLDKLLKKYNKDLEKEKAQNLIKELSNVSSTIKVIHFLSRIIALSALLLDIYVFYRNLPLVAYDVTTILILLKLFLDLPDLYKIVFTYKEYKELFKYLLFLLIALNFPLGELFYIGANLRGLNKAVHHYAVKRLK